MADQTDSLVEIPEEKWPSLLDYFQNGPNTITAKAAIKTQILNRGHIPEFPVRIFAPYNEPKEGIVMLWQLTPALTEISTFYIKDAPTKLMNAIRETKLLDFHKIIFLICAVVPVLQQPWKDLMKELKIKSVVHETYIAHLQREKAEKIKNVLNDDVEMKQLNEKYADEINEAWPHRYPGSEIYFRNMLNWGFGYGLVGKKKQDLRAWCFLSVRGDLHSLYVQEAHRRKGYAQSVIMHLSKICIEREIEIFGCVVTENEPSKTLFKNMGFEFEFIGAWISNPPSKT